MSTFDAAIGYVLKNEGGYSNALHDHGGKTNFGITEREAIAHGFTIATLTLDQALSIYKHDYWKFDGVTDERVATKMLDMVVNLGIGMRLIQRAAGVREDGVYGPKTEAAINALDPDAALEKLSLAAGQHYVAICLHDHTQLIFLRDWVGRAIERPPITYHPATT